jgi:DNA mismatch endonuclease, patch repair protein
MRRVKTRDTSLELAAREWLDAHGYRASRHPPSLFGRPDLIFPGLRLVVFVHGCFWHGHFCRPSYVAKTNVAFWEAKISANMRRDLRVVRELRAQGWSCYVAWQCSLENDLRRIERALAKKRLRLRALKQGQ